MVKRTETSAATTPPHFLLAALRKLLKPLVRLLLNYQVSYPLLAAMLKEIYVDVAEVDFKVDNKRASDSRINLLTGVHRKDVKRLRTLGKTTTSTPSTASTGARVIGIWLASPDFLDKHGNPVALPIKNPESTKPSFDDLVTKVCKQNIRPRVLLDEWIRLGVAHLDEENRVVLNTGAFTPEEGLEEKVYFFGRNIQDHLAASTHNLLGIKPSYFDRSVYYDELSETSVRELAELADELGMAALREMNKQALRRQQKDRGKAIANYRINFGIFNFNAKRKSNDSGTS